MSSKRVYFGVIEASSDGYGIYFPDFPGCVSGGDDLEHLARMAHEGLQLHIEAMVADGDAIPEPSTPSLAHEQSETPEADLRGLLAVEVTVPTFPDTVDVPLDLGLVQEIDRLVPNRRQFIMEATRRELERLQKSA